MFKKKESMELNNSMTNPLNVSPAKITAEKQKFEQKSTSPTKYNVKNTEQSPYKPNVSNNIDGRSKSPNQLVKQLTNVSGSYINVFFLVLI